jgi:phosphohistidine swiveling domain-containing protein
MNNITLLQPELNLSNKELLSKDLAVVSKETFIRAIRRRVPFLMDGYGYAAHAVTRRWGIDICFFEAGHEQVKSCYISNAMNTHAAEIWLGKMDEDPHFTKNLLEEVRNLIVIEKNFANSIPQHSLSVEETKDYVIKYLEWWVGFFEVAYLWFCVENIKEKIDEEIRLTWKGDGACLDSFIENVYRLKALPVSSIEQRDLLKVSVLSGDEFEVALGKHCEQYKHLSLRDPDDQYFDLEYYRSRAKSMSDPIEYQKQKDLLESAELEMSEADILLKNYEISETLKNRIEFVRWFMYLRTESIDAMTLVNSSFKNVLNSLVEKLNISMDEVLHMTFKEIVDSLDTGNLAIDHNLIMERLNNGYAYLIAPHASYLVTGNDVDELHQLVIPKQNEEVVKELKGQIAYKGKVSGIARVILDRRHTGDLKEGEILVTTMTTPEFVPAMKLSSGIITNEGGILCHAAIMSREFQKPCIIGTKIATDAIKTGQRVTLDADKGIIILE